MTHNTTQSKKLPHPAGALLALGTESSNGMNTIFWDTLLHILSLIYPHARSRAVWTPQRKVVSICTKMSDTQNSVFYPHSFCVLYYSHTNNDYPLKKLRGLSPQANDYPLTIINQFFLRMEENCVLCEVQTETSYTLSLIYLTITVCHLLSCVWSCSWLSRLRWYDKRDGRKWQWTVAR